MACYVSLQNAPENKITPSNTGTHSSIPSFKFKRPKPNTQQTPAPPSEQVFNVDVQNKQGQVVAMDEGNDWVDDGEDELLLAASQMGQSLINKESNVVDDQVAILAMLEDEDFGLDDIASIGVNSDNVASPFIEKEDINTEELLAMKAILEDDDFDSDVLGQMDRNCSNTSPSPTVSAAAATHNAPANIEVSPTSILMSDDDDMMLLAATQVDMVEAAKANVLSKLEESLEKEYQCPTCLEVFITPVALNCGHTYCWLCLAQWKSSNSGSTCPECREAILNENRVLAIDHMIEAMMEQLGEDKRKERNEKVKERKEAENQFKAKSTAAVNMAARGAGSMGQGRANLRGARRGVVRRGGFGQGGRGGEVPPEGSYYGGVVTANMRPTIRGRVVVTRRGQAQAVGREGSRREARTLAFLSPISISSGEDSNEEDSESSDSDTTSFSLDETEQSETDEDF